MIRTLRAAARVLAVSALAAALAPAATAQNMGTFSFQPPAKVFETMEKEKVPALLVFKSPGDASEQSLTFQFATPAVQDALKKGRFQAAQFSISDVKSSRPWGSAQKYADEFGVPPTTTLIVLAYDRTVLAQISQVVKRDEFIVNISSWSKANSSKVKANEEVDRDLDSVEKWIGEKKWPDAIRRVKSVLSKEGKISKPLVDRAKELDGKIESAGAERVAEGKSLADGGKTKEGKAILEDVAKTFKDYECGKEAKEALKGIKG